MNANERARRRCMTHEGLSLVRYKDGRGWAIGYGHHVSRRDDIPISCTPSQAVRWFMDDWSNAREAVRSMFRRRKYRLPDNDRFGVLIEMCFQLGPRGLAGFPKFLKAVDRNHWKHATEQMLMRAPPHDTRPSNWARQTPDRVDTLVAVMLGAEEAAVLRSIEGEPAEREPGQVAFEAYLDSERAFLGKGNVRLPDWDTLKPYMQDAWRAAAAAVLAE